MAANPSVWQTPLNNFAPFPGEYNGLGNDAENWGTYVHLVVIGALAAFAMAWSIGANDVANSFATSVGSKTVTLWQACCIAAVFEFVGAMVLGGEVARTIAGSITSPAYFQETPEIFMFGMVCALISAATIVTLATYWSAAVSTTHSIIGAVLGFGLVFGGADSIVWNQKTSSFPYRTGVVSVFLSWVCAPVSAAILSAVIFFLNRTIVLRRKNSTEWAFWSLPVLAFLTIFINIFFVLYKGAGKDLTGQVGSLYWDKAGNTAAWVSAVAGAGGALLSIPAVFWLKKKHAQKDIDLAAAADAAAIAGPDQKVKEDMEAGQAASEDAVPSNRIARVGQKIMNHMKYSLNVDVHEDVHKDATIAAIHASGEVFNPKTEEVYKYLQVFSACCVAFAHGSNDVANAIGPFAGIWYVYQNFNVSSSAETPKWILAMGGAGLVVGLATYGYNIIKVLGVGFALMTPCRGFSAELATGCIIALSSVYGLPVSTTQTIVGAEMGVGIVEGGLKRSGANWGLFGRTFFGWVLAFVCSAFFSAAIFSFGVYAPSVNDLDTVNNYNRAMNSVINAQINVMNSTNEYAQAAGLARYSAPLETQLTTLGAGIKAVMDLKKNGKVNMYEIMSLLKNSTGLYFAQTVPVYNTTA